MRKKPKIFITGVARSGTTLLKNLFWAFEDVWVIKEEVNIYDFVKTKYPGRILVGKRTMKSIYSHCMLPKQEVEKQKELIDRHDIKVVNIIRNRDDVVKSWGRVWGIPKAGGIDWDLTVPGSYKAFTILYEELIRRPDYYQEGIAEYAGLEILHNFSEYPDFVPEEYGGENEYKLRKLNESWK